MIWNIVGNSYPIRPNPFGGCLMLLQEVRLVIGNVVRIDYPTKIYPSVGWLMLLQVVEA